MGLVNLYPCCFCPCAPPPEKNKFVPTVKLDSKYGTILSNKCQLLGQPKMGMTRWIFTGGDLGKNEKPWVLLAGTT